MRLTVAVTGAGGFVGRHLIQALSPEHQVVALSRSRPKDLPADVQWRKCDLFSARSIREALQGVDVAYYLVHSMLPSSELFQGSFHDTDLALADNFARGCRDQAVKQVIYLGGLMPEGYISPHLQSRFEVEGVLAQFGLKTTVFRAGMVVGPGGSSWGMLESLVKRLPVMVLPRWTRRNTQAVFIDDVVRVLSAAANHSELQGKVWDLVNGEGLNYESLLRRTADVLGLRRWAVGVPINSTAFSKRWVQLFGGQSFELVSPLIDSLLCDLPTPSIAPELSSWIYYRNFESMARASLEREGLIKRFPTANHVVSISKSGGQVPASHLPEKPQKKARTILYHHSVRSIQRLPSLPNRDADWIAREYMRFLPQIFRTLIQVRIDETSGKVGFFLSFVKKPLLLLQYIPQDSDRFRRKFHIIGGFLSKTGNTGWLEFRQIENRRYTLAAIHEFVPSLPWWLYRVTQAPLHTWVMRRFTQHLLLTQHSPQSE